MYIPRAHTLTSIHTLGVDEKDLPPKIRARLAVYALLRAIRLKETVGLTHAAYLKHLVDLQLEWRETNLESQICLKVSATLVLNHVRGRDVQRWDECHRTLDILFPADAVPMLARERTEMLRAFQQATADDDGADVSQPNTELLRALWLKYPALSNDTLLEVRALKS